MTLTDPRFFQTAGPFTLGRLLFELGLEERDRIDGHSADKTFIDVAALSEAGPSHLSFFHNRKYLSALTKTKAGAVLVSEAEAHHVPEGCARLIVTDPYRAYGQMAALFHPVWQGSDTTEIHPTAHVDPSAQIGAGVRVGAFSSIGANASVGAGSLIGAHCVIGEGVVVGECCVFEGHCTVSHALIGDRVHLKPGARIGQGGFGWALDLQALQHQRIPQLGRVVLGDDVELGANTTVDRGAGPDTVVGRGTVIDNQCQIAHNVRLGRGCVVVAGSSIAGSAILEDGVLVGGCSGVLGHVTIGAGSQIQASSSVTKSCPAGSILRGVPARDYRLYLREEATLRRSARARAQDAEE